MSTCIVVEKIKIEWFSNIRADILSGIVVALALIPEALAFSIIAGVDPVVGLYESFIIVVVVSLVCGLTAMIYSAAVVIALLMWMLVRVWGMGTLLVYIILVIIFVLLD